MLHRKHRIHAVLDRCPFRRTDDGYAAEADFERVSANGRFHPLRTLNSLDFHPGGGHWENVGGRPEPEPTVARLWASSEAKGSGGQHDWPG